MARRRDGRFQNRTCANIFDDPSRPTMRAFLALILLSMLFAACGYKGALYLPQEKPAAQKAAAEPASENEDKKPSSK